MSITSDLIDEAGRLDPDGPTAKAILAGVDRIDELELALEDLLDRLDECVEEGAIDAGLRVHRGMVSAREALEKR